MLKMDIAFAVDTMVETMLPRFADRNIGLMISLDLRDNDYENDKSACTHIYAIFHRPNNYTKVLVNYNFNSGLCDKDPRRETVYFKQYSNHDSCWRLTSDGGRFLSEHWSNVKKYFGKHPSDISQFYSFSMFSRPQYIEFEKFEEVREGEWDGIAGYNIWDGIAGYNIKVKRSISLNEIHKYLEK